MPDVRILIDADACPVKDEVYRVAFRRGVSVKVVSNARIRIPDHPLVERVVVSDAFDAADDWIAEAAGSNDVVITGDILLADRALKAGATVLGHNGKPFTNSGIGAAIATRDHGRPQGWRRRHHRRPRTVRQGRPIAVFASARRGAG